MPAAERDVRIIRAVIARDKPQAATRWANNVRRLIRSLRMFPERHEVIPEAADRDFESEYRHLIFGNYRILYRVEESRVFVVRVIRAARELTEEMLGDEPP